MIILNPLTLSEVALFTFFCFQNPYQIAKSNSYFLFSVILAQYSHFLGTSFILTDKDVYLIALILNTLFLYRHYFLETYKTFEPNLMYSISCLIFNLKICQSMYLYITQCTISWSNPLLIAHILFAIIGILLFIYVTRSLAQKLALIPLVGIYIYFFYDPSLLVTQVMLLIGVVLSSIVAFLFAQNKKQSKFSSDSLFWILYTLIYLGSIYTLIVYKWLIQNKNK